MLGGRREWLLDQLFPIIVTAVNYIPWHCTCNCGWVHGRGDDPNICQMINLSTSLQISGGMSLSVLSEYIATPGRVFSIRCCHRGFCIHQWTFTFTLSRLSLHLSMLDTRSHAFPHSFLFLPCCFATGQNICSAVGYFFSLVQTRSTSDILYILSLTITHAGYPSFFLCIYMIWLC